MPDPSDTTVFMTKAEAAAFLRLTVRGLEQKMASRSVPYYKMGRRVLFRRSVLEQWLEQKCLVPAKGMRADLPATTALVA